MNNEATFLEAVTSGDLASVRTMLDADGALASTRGANGTSAFLLAIYHGRPDVAAAIREHRDDLDIFEAAAAGDAARVAHHLDADPALASAYSSDGFQPLGLASFFGHVETARLLLDRGADVNGAARNEMRVRPIHSAAANRDAAAAVALSRLLLEHGADPNVEQHGGWTPMQQAAQHGNEELRELLVRYGGRENVKGEGTRPVN